MMLLKEDLINALAKKGYTKKSARVIVTDFCTTVMELLAAEDGVRISGFGTFEKKHRAPKLVSNPQTGEPMYTHEKNVVKFVSGGTFKRVRMSARLPTDSYAESQQGDARIQ